MGKRKKGRWKYNYCHAGQVRQELAANCEFHEDGERVRWGRPRRGYRYLNQWDNDKPHNHENSWKKSRKAQYRNRSTTKHSIELDTNEYKWWDVKRWFDDHDIPVRLEEIRETERYMVYRERRRVFVGRRIDLWYRWRTITVSHKETKTVCTAERTEYDRYEYKWFDLDVPREEKRIRVVGHKLVWWADKDIGIDYVLKRCRWHTRRYQ